MTNDRRLPPLVFMGLLAALGALLSWHLGVYSPKVNQRARAHVCAIGMSNVLLALSQYRDDHEGDLPESLDQLVPKYLVLDAVPMCPENDRTGYAYNPSRGTVMDAAPSHLLKVGPRRVVGLLTDDGYVIYLEDPGTGDRELFKQGSLPTSSGVPATSKTTHASEPTE